ncbi:hypothetical protein [Clostridium sp.]|uniref:hypothetical protein n=1 Tax=Clostridium sp. TaxID=1506 RepID=UPI00262E1883|nr:hypothetical protein [Clostridium sp.]
MVSQKHNKKSSAKIEDDNPIKYFLLGFENWFAGFRGVASKYLQRYLSFFILFNLDKVVDYMDIMYNILFLGNKFMKTARIRSIRNYIY